MEKEIAEFVRLFEGEKDFIMQDVTNRVSNSLVRLSPVDEGEYVAEWDAEIGHWPSDTKQPPDKRKTTTRRRLQGEFARVEWGDAVFFENTDPVAARLEFGYSDQAPQGVARLTTRKFRGFVRGAGRAAQNKIKKRISGD